MCLRRQSSEVRESNCVVGLSEKNVRLAGEADVVIIGSGIAGLSCAVMLSRAGWRVHVLERHDRVGGTMHTFRLGNGDSSWEFDAGVHYVGANLVRSSLFRRLVRNNVEWCRMADDFDRATLASNTGVEGRCDADEWTWRMSSSPAKVAARLREKFPRHVDRVARFLRTSRRCAFWFRALNVCLKLLPMAAAKALQPYLVALFALVARVPVGSGSRASTSQVLAACGLDPASADPETRQVAGVLTYFWPDVGLPPDATPFAVGASKIATLADGAYFPKGSGSAIAVSLAESAVATGRCSIFVRAPVDRIEATNGRVLGVVARGISIPAARVISAAGIYNTLARLLPHPRDGAFLVDREYSVLAERIRDGSLPVSATWISLFVGLDAPGDTLQLPKHNLFCFPSWAHDCNVERSHRDGLDGEFPACFITSSSAKDARSSRGCVNVLALVEWEWFAPYASGGGKENANPAARARSARKDTAADYEALKARLTARLLHLLYRQMPQLKGHIVYTNLATPLSVNRFLGTSRGEFNGLAHNQERFDATTQRLLRPKLPFIRGLFLTGHDITQQGLPASLASAVYTVFALSPLAFLRFLPYVLWDLLVAVARAFFVVS